jgi:hypothetical protein
LILRNVRDAMAMQTTFDVNVANSDLQVAAPKVVLAAPRHVLHAKQGVAVAESREQRLLREFKFAAAVQESQYRALDERGIPFSLYDTELRIFPVEDRLSRGFSSSVPMAHHTLENGGTFWEPSHQTIELLHPYFDLSQCHTI